MTRPDRADCLVYTVPEAGALLGLTKNASYEAAKRGDLPILRIGKLLKVPKAALHAMIGSAEALSVEKADPT
ncbi:helix-turn-helix domain-containing protein [Bradyrhizobium sp. 41S5]|uniref:helix-turn-helix domain-containing protein n=1 Tax=Bradyrhizobium sp. 41S5 TaxID=1404443 RepID=UPI00156B6B2E|nr:helix-turn-helix domain-containing protein [Bradyrhizobium sp. 41S5]UFX41706.1 helix-turn-helix domain-containing protein [Bradyrhizobium sp. 41S5]